MRPIVIVAAVAENRVIGADNRLIWRLKSDLRRFKEITWGRPLIMGRKTFESIGRPLPGRETVVLTRDPSFDAKGAEVARSLDEAISAAEAAAERLGAPEIVVAGGAQVYSQAMPLAERLRLTLVHARPQGDACFPDYDWGDFRETFREDRPEGPDDEHAFTFVDLERRQRVACS